MVGGRGPRVLALPRGVLRGNVVPWGVLLVGTLLISGCSGRAPDPSPSPSALAPSLDPASAEAARQARDAYINLRETQITAYAKASFEKDLEKYAGDNALAAIWQSLFVYQREGIVFTGRPAFNPQVTEVRFQPYPQVTLVDCFDRSSWKAVVSKTGRSAEVADQNTRVAVTALARPYAGGWIIADLTVDGSQTC